MYIFVYIYYRLMSMDCQVGGFVDAGSTRACLIGILCCSCWQRGNYHGPLARYVKLWIAHAPGMPGTFSPPPRVSDPGMHHGTCVTHVPWCIPGSLASDFLWNRWRGKRSRHSRRMHHPQFHVSDKRSMKIIVFSNTRGCMCELSMNWIFIISHRVVRIAQP